MTLKTCFHDQPSGAHRAALPDLSRQSRGSILYRTIVADPPWDHSTDTARFTFGDRDPRGRSGKHAPAWGRGLPYPTMTVDEIAALHPPAADDAHLYLWTTNRYLEAAHAVARAWGFTSPPTVLVWCKPQDQGLFGGAFLSNVEYVLFARRGSLAHESKVGSRWFQWPRGRHSEKPEAFLDMVESMSPGPYLELFARRARLGWDVWGDEVDSHVDVLAGHKSGEEHRNAVPASPQANAKPTKPTRGAA